MKDYTLTVNAIKKAEGLLRELSSLMTTDLIEQGGKNLIRIEDYLYKTLNSADFPEIKVAYETPLETNDEDSPCGRLELTCHHCKDDPKAYLIVESGRGKIELELDRKGARFKNPILGLDPIVYLCYVWQNVKPEIENKIEDSLLSREKEIMRKRDKLDIAEEVLNNFQL